MTILYLYAELMGYQIPVLKQYTEAYQAEVHVVHWDKKKLTPYAPPVLRSIYYHKRSEHHRVSLLKFATELAPDIVYVSGWMDRDYIYVCKQLRKLGIPVVSGSDSQWYGSWKQRVGRYYFRLFLKHAYDYIWVAGPYQFEYARKLGFKKEEIIFNSYTADTSLFKAKLENESKQVKHTRRFLFVGRFEEVKGIRLLIDAWDSINEKDSSSLTFIGNGSLKSYMEQHSGIIVKDFLQPEDLVSELQDSDCLILPSLREPWALVIQEACSSGLPVIASDVCGAAPVFITNGYNGYTFKTRNVDDLRQKIINIMNLDEDELYDFKSHSVERSRVISPQISAAAFMSVIDFHKHS